MPIQDEFSEDQEGKAGWRSTEVATTSLDFGSIFEINENHLTQIIGRRADG